MRLSRRILLGAAGASVLAAAVPWPALLAPAALARALAANPGARVKGLPGLNHFFQAARSGEPDEVATLEETMAPALLALVGDWATCQVGTAGQACRI